MSETQTRKSGVVVIAGRPNAGKSTLLNRAVGATLSVVSPKPQTTRDGVRGILTEPQGQIVFVDTPGIHRAKEGGINHFMMNEVDQALEAPDLVWYLVEPKSAIEPEKMVIERLAKAKAPVFLILGKQDVKSPATEEERQQRFSNDLRTLAQEQGLSFEQEFRISSRTGQSINELLTATWGALKPGPLLYPDEEALSDRHSRFFVAEMVREQLFTSLGEELPYSCAVQVTDYIEATQPIRILATIHVERDSQKGMVIGKGGTKIKEIGSLARVKIEEFLGKPIFLGLKVEVAHQWTRDPDRLRELGYALPAARRKN